MTLDEKIERSIDSHLEDMLQLFQSANDAQDLSGELDKLYKRIKPLLENIKSEIKDIQNQVHKKPEEEPEEDEEPVDTPPNDPDLQDYLEELPDLLDKAKKMKDAAKQLTDNLPAPITEAPKRLFDLVPGASEASLFFKLWAASDIINRNIKDFGENLRSLILKDKSLKQATDDQIKSGVQATHDLLELINEDTLDVIKDRVERLSPLPQDVEDLEEELSRCCSNMSDSVGKLDDRLCEVKLSALRLPGQLATLRGLL